MKVICFRPGVQKESLGPAVFYLCCCGCTTSRQVSHLGIFTFRKTKNVLKGSYRYDGWRKLTIQSKFRGKMLRSKTRTTHSVIHVKHEHTPLFDESETCSATGVGWWDGPNRHLQARKPSGSITYSNNLQRWKINKNYRAKGSQNNLKIFS